MATTPYPFVSGATLTASQLNSTFNIPVSTKVDSYVLVAADAGTRVVMNKGTATTITVNTGLFSAGDSLEIANIGVGVCTLTSGTCTVTTTGSLALAQNASGKLIFISASAAIYVAGDVAGGGITLVKTQTIGTTVSSVTVSDVFSATYNAYKIIIDGGVGSATALLGLQLGAAATGYYEAAIRANYATGALDSGAASNTTSFARAGNVNANYINLSCEVINPFAAKYTLVNGMWVSLTQGGQHSGYLADTTSYTAFTLTPASGTLTGGTIKVYGYQV